MGDKKSFTYKLKTYLTNSDDRYFDEIKDVSVKYLLNGINILNIIPRDKILYFNHLVNNYYVFGTSESLLKFTKRFIHHTGKTFDERLSMYKPVYGVKYNDLSIEYAKRMELDSYHMKQIDDMIRYDNGFKKKLKSDLGDEFYKHKGKSPDIGSKKEKVKEESRLSVKKIIKTIESKEIGNCKSCPLYNDDRMVSFDSNAEYADEITVLMVGEAPATEEVKLHKPFVGKSGKLIREIIERYPDIKYGITNTAMCFHQPGNAPTEVEIKSCRPNVQFIIDHLPNLEKIILIGGVSNRAFLNKDKIKITKLHGKEISAEIINSPYKFDKKISVYSLYHPSYALRNGTQNQFKSQLETVYTSKDTSISSQSKTSRKTPKKSLKTPFINSCSSLKEIIDYMNKHEEKYTLVNIQPLVITGDKWWDKSLLFSFRGISKKKYLFLLKNPKQKFWYSDVENDIAIKSMKELHEVETLSKNIKFKVEEIKGTIYQSDYPVHNYYSNEYYRNQNTKESDIDLNVMIFDIELLMDEKKALNQKDLQHRVICYTVYNSYDDEYTFVYDQEWADNIDEKKIIEEYKDHKIKIIKVENEQKLLEWLFEYMEKVNPDVITNWNVGFDIDSVMTRYKNLTGDFPIINGEQIHFDYKYGVETIAGIVIVDYNNIYKLNDSTKKTSYKLDAIGKFELGVGKTAYTGSLNDLAKSNATLFSIYNINDVILVKMIDDKRKLIDKTNTLKKVSASTWREAEKYIGIALIDSALIFRANNRGDAIINKTNNPDMGKYEGAFVLTPFSVFNQWLVVYDLASLYPHVMSRYNMDRSTYVLKIMNRQVVYDLLHNKENPTPEDYSKYVTIILNPDNYKREEKRITVGELINYIEKHNLIVTITGTCFLPHTKRKSILYIAIDEFYRDRLRYKDLMEKASNEIERNIYDSYQYTDKILMNALYGVQGNPAFRLYQRDIAETITLSAKEVSKFSAAHTHQFLEALKQGNEDSFEIDYIYDFFTKERMESVQYMDTDSIFVIFKDIIGKKLSTEQALKKILPLMSKLLSFYNDRLLLELIRRHNLDPSDGVFNFNFKVEKIIKNMFIPAKKTYAYYMVWEEGHIVDEIKFKGLSVVRSDYPEWTKTMLKELANLILKEEIGETPEKLKVWLVNKFNEGKDLISRGDFSIARPLSINKPLEAYASITESVKGAIYWNYMIYDHFNQFDKGYHFYITDIKIEELIDISHTISNMTEYYDKYDKLLSWFDKILQKNKKNISNIEKYKSNFKIDSILIPIEPKNDEPTFYNLPTNIFTPDVQKMIKNAFTSRVDQFVAPLGIDINKIVGNKSTMNSSILTID